MNIHRRSLIVDRTVVLFHSVISAGTLVAASTPTVTGGPDASGHNYSWSITNNDPSPIVSVQIPHFEGDLCLAPPNWTGSMSPTPRAHAPDGACDYAATNDSTGITTGRAASFQLRVGPKGAARGKGVISIAYADGRKELVPAQVPVRAPFGDQFVSLAALALIFVTFLTVRAFRRKRGGSTVIPSGDATVTLPR